MRDRGKHGTMAGLFGCIFAVLGILTLGVLFVPIAIVCSVMGLLRSAVSLNLSGLMVSGLGFGLSIVGIAMSPSLLVIAGVLLALQM